jgi:hypothetical protein
VDATVTLTDGRPGVRLTVLDDAPTAEGLVGTRLTWQSPL